MKPLPTLCITAAHLCLASAARAGLPWNEAVPTDGGQGTAPGGGLIDSLFSGAPFTGFTTMDVTVLGILAGVGAYLLLRSRSRHEDDTRSHDIQGKPSQDDVPGPGKDSRAYRRAQQTWDFLSTRPESQQQRNKDEAAAPPERHSSPIPDDMGSDLARDLPATPSAEEAGFDTTDLLQGAKVVYARMHESIAESDWDDVEQFTTQQFLQELKQRVASRRNPPQVLFVEAAVERAQTQDGRNVADVVFASLMQFEENQSPREVRETWRFEKGPDTGGTWRISAMQRRQ